MTKVLCSTERTQGQRKNDFCWVPEGEVVGFAFECDGESLDGSCGCRRSFSGLDCLKATTTVEVVDIPHFSEARLADHIVKSLTAGGWAKLLGDDETREIAEQDAAELLRLASLFPIGAVVEKRGDSIRQRA